MLRLNGYDDQTTPLHRKSKFARQEFRNCLVPGIKYIIGNMAY